MTTAANFNGWAPEGIYTQLPPASTVPMQANAEAGRGQFLTYNSAGDAALNDGATPGLVAAGIVHPAIRTNTSSVAGAAYTEVWTGYGRYIAASTETGDGFTKADVCKPFFIADENTLGKLSNFGGDNRSLGGLVLGVDGVTGEPRFWCGPVAHAVARGVLIADAFPLADDALADAAASTTTAERAMRRPKVKGTVASIEFTGAAIAADNTDYVTVTVAKRDGAGGAAVTLGTYDSRAANQGAVTAFIPKAFSLSAVAGALYVLETDVVTITVAKGGSGKTLTGAVLVNGKAL